MAKGDSVDLMMKFVVEGDRALAGEATTILVSSEGEKNPLTRGFKPGFFSEIDRFSMKAGIRDDDPSAGQSATGTRTHAALDLATPRPITRTIRNPDGTTSTETIQLPRQTGSLQSTAARGSYQSWRSGTNRKGFPVDLAPVSFTRVIDKTSTKLIQSCIDSTSFDSISLIKRKSSGIESITGEVGSGEVFLRVDFIGCLIIKVDWDNDDKVNESIDFICRTVSIHYRPQLPDGSLGRMKPGFYSMVGDQQPPMT
jgi:type VI protein secretion system component Hcp